VRAPCSGRRQTSSRSLPGTLLKKATVPPGLTWIAASRSSGREPAIYSRIYSTVNSRCRLVIRLFGVFDGFMMKLPW